MPYNFVADVFTQTNFVEDFLKAKCNLSRKTAVLQFSAPFEGFRDNVWCSSLTHWKVHSRLPNSVKWTFFLGATTEALRANIDWKSAFSLQQSQYDPTFQAEGITHTNHSSSHKTKLNDLSYGIKIRTELSSVLSQITHLTDGQTENFLVASLRRHSMQRGNKQMRLDAIPSIRIPLLHTKWMISCKWIGIPLPAESTSPRYDLDLWLLTLITFSTIWWIFLSNLTEILPVQIYGITPNRCIVTVSFLRHTNTLTYLLIMVRQMNGQMDNLKTSCFLSPLAPTAGDEMTNTHLCTSCFCFSNSFWTLLELLTVA